MLDSLATPQVTAGRRLVTVHRDRQFHRREEFSPILHLEVRVRLKEFNSYFSR